MSLSIKILKRQPYGIYIGVPIKPESMIGGEFIRIVYAPVGYRIGFITANKGYTQLNFIPRFWLTARVRMARED